MKNILLDTDISADCDDTGALAVLHSFENRGECKIIGCVVNGRDEDASAGASVFAINSYYGRSGIPIGTFHGEAKLTKSAYTLAVRKKFAPDYPDDLHLPTALEVYRRALAGAEDGSVTIVSIGFFQNLRDLLESGADAISPLFGIDLIRKKVRELVVMGGAFPASKSDEPEFNFGWAGVASATQPVIEKWPTPIVLTGFELGLPIRTGQSLASTPESNPVRLAYELFKGGEGFAIDAGRNSWDQTAAWLAVRGTDGLWDLSEPGFCQVAATGCNTWEADPKGPHRYIIARAPLDTVTKLIEAEMVAPPRKV